AEHKSGEEFMTAGLYDLPTIGAQTLRALGRYPDRIAFSWPSGSLRYRGAIDLIGRMQQVFVQLGLRPGSCIAFLTANRADTCRAGPVDVATLNYTGGTTGKSKGALRHHREYASFAGSILADFEFPDRPQYLAVAPISHVAGSKVLPTLIRGGTVHMLKGFDPEAVFRTIARERINFTLFVPTMIYVMLDHPALGKTDLSSLELLLYGASAMSPSRLVEGIERIGPVFSQLYGQTECYPVSVLRKADHDPKPPELFLSCGFPIAACQVKILDNADQEVATGEAGEICVRAGHVMAEYWKRPDTTAETLKNGWLHTGDVARSDERGYMFILDRKKDMIVSG